MSLFFSELQQTNNPTPQNVTPPPFPPPPTQKKKFQVLSGRKLRLIQSFLLYFLFQILTTNRTVH